MRKIMMGSKIDDSRKLSSMKTKPQRNENTNILTLSRMVPRNDNTWLIDSGASRHMNGLRNHLTHFVEKERHIHVFLGDDVLRNKHQYSIEKPQEKYSTP
jgi:hypothetical protein